MENISCPNCGEIIPAPTFTIDEDWKQSKCLACDFLSIFREGKIVNRPPEKKVKIRQR